MAQHPNWTNRLPTKATDLWYCGAMRAPDDITDLKL